ncbi:MAG: Gp138 family membrane-puncturing spike protein [Janthinobacterium lividum]
MSSDQDHDQFESAVRQIMSDINTSMPGVIVSYNATTRRAVVKPSMSKQIADGRVLTPPSLVSVPVQFPGSRSVAFTWPLMAGDGVNLHFSQRSLDGWHDAGNGIPDDPRQYDLSDAVACPGLDHLGNTAAADATNAVWSFGGCTITMSPSGVMTYHAAQHVFQGPVSAPNDDITSKNVTVAEHVHINTQAQSGSFSGPPESNT